MSGQHDGRMLQDVKIRSLHGRLPIAILGLLLLLAVTSPARASRPPLRSGRIISGVLTTSPAWNCGMVPDCAAWLAADCDPALAGRDPSWLASIERVAGLADGSTKRVFEYGPAKPVGFAPGGVRLEFWTRDCTRISERLVWIFGAPWRMERIRDLVIPRQATWMTVTGNDKVNIDWALR